jgi:hypothetical protein
MRRIAFLSVVFALSLCVRAGAQTTSSPDSTPKAYTMTAVAETEPILGKPSCIHIQAYEKVGLLRGLVTRGGMTSGELVLSDLDMKDMKAECIAGQLEATVPNRQKVRIQLLTTDGYECTATPTFKSDPKPDFLSTITTLVKPVVGIAAAKPVVKIATAKGVQNTGNVNPPEQRISLPSVTSGTMTVLIDCKPKPDANISQDTTNSQDTKGSQVNKVWQSRTVIIHYKNPPQISASAGTLVSLYGKHVFGVTTSQTGVNSSGVATTENTITLTQSNVQLIPIGFLNTYISGTDHLHLDLQAGLGINPNGSKTEVEYFFGPALTMHGIYLAPGLHIARASYLGGGFSQGEVIPSGVTPPVNYRATYRFAFAISYSPPVKSAN